MLVLMKVVQVIPPDNTIPYPKQIISWTQSLKPQYLGNLSASVRYPRGTAEHTVTEGPTSNTSETDAHTTFSTLLGHTDRAKVTTAGNT
jgi:hypothetical protein